MRLFGLALAALAAGSLTACQVAAPKGPVPEPPPRPDRTAGVSPAARPVQGPSKASADLANYLARVQNDLLVRGLMRRDGGGPDSRFDAETLAANFERIAFFDEHGSAGGREVIPSIRKWSGPVRVQLHFGSAVPQETRQKDRQGLAPLVNRLARATRHPVVAVSGAGNFHVLVLTEDERRTAGPLMRALLPGIAPGAVRVVETMPRTQYCLVFSFSGPGRAAITSAMAVIRAENPDLLRLSCLHEEVTQGLGLSNDSRKARPSIFNDDEEFALLTTHDELLLRMLYDTRLPNGIGLAQARPIITRMAQELAPGPS